MMTNMDQKERFWDSSTLVFPANGSASLIGVSGLEEQLTPLWQQLCARKDYAAFVSFDLDGLKTINDTYGHQAGDFAIRLTAEAIRRAAPKEALSTRMGGDEFLTVIPRANEAAAERFMRDFRTQLDGLNRQENRAFRVDASCGAVVFRLNEFSSLEECIAAAMQLSTEHKRAVMHIYNSANPQCSMPSR